MKNKENRDSESFILCQFQSLMCHIDNLISSSTMRVYSILIVWALIISAMSVILSGNSISLENRRWCLIGVSSFLVLIGLYMYDRQIRASINIVFYYRIINRIRNTYNKKYPEIKRILHGLPSSEDKPKNILDIFEPGIIILMFLNAIVFALGCFFIFENLIVSLFSFIIVIILEIVRLKYKEHKYLSKNKN